MIKAAIDIGSNAVRLLIADIAYDGKGGAVINKHQLVRLPIRLGEDVFSRGIIGAPLQSKLIKGIDSLKAISELYQSTSLRCTATSALREAGNKDEIIYLVEELTGVKIELIEGSKEAQIILEGISKALPEEVNEFIHVDVGGGSTELNYIKNNELKASKSFKIGSVRLMNEQVSEQEWKDLEQFIDDLKIDHIKFGAGSGGNINKLMKLAGDKENKFISNEALNNILAQMGAMSLEERITKYLLKPDRADVIVFAGQIYASIFNKLQVESIFVPKVGLADGIILSEK